MLPVSSTLICGLTALRWAPAWPQQHRPRSAVRATEEELDRFFFDRAEVFTRGGAGGEGAVATQGSGRLPAGGTGGDGGSVYIECCAETNTLGHLHGRFHVRAERGADASGRRDGTRGGDATVRVPPHTLIIDRATNATLGQLLIGERLLVAAGGAGGEGNGARYRRLGVDNKKAGAPGPADKLALVLEMTLVADVGLIGYPNAGKSTLLTHVTRATPKIANYPFTTLVPNLGVCEAATFGLAKGMVWLDIPGLVDGAHAGRGIGRAFLRHTERCRLLLHLIDGESETSPNPSPNPNPGPHPHPQPNPQPNPGPQPSPQPSPNPEQARARPPPPTSPPSIASWCSTARSSHRPPRWPCAPRLGLGLGLGPNPNPKP